MQGEHEAILEWRVRGHIGLPSKIVPPASRDRSSFVVVASCESHDFANATRVVPILGEGCSPRHGTVPASDILTHCAVLTGCIEAIVDGKLVSFARRSYLLPGYAWFEGARTDPAYRNMGVFQAISRHFLEAMQREGADTIGLSTHVDNKASIHIIEKSGFRKAASYIYLEVGAMRRSETTGSPLAVF